MQVFEETKLATCKLQNRVFRSATFEGMADSKGYPTEEYISYYRELSKHHIGAIITGCVYVVAKGKLIQPGQPGIDSDELIPEYRKLTSAVHANNGKLFMQLIHAGRQTRSKLTGSAVVGPSSKPSRYFREKPKRLSIDGIYLAIDQFVQAAYRAKKANFDGIQLHAAHGYLIHQFILPSVNKRRDQFGIDKKLKIGTRFLELIIEGIRNKCGNEFPILLKISGSDDYSNKFSKEQFTNLIQFLNKQPIDGIEISYGTMDQPLNIFRGDFPVEYVFRHNKMYKTNSKILKAILRTTIFPYVNRKLIPFTNSYNLDFALIAKQYTQKPIILVGGIRSGKEINSIIEDKNIDYVSLSRPFICEPDFVEKLKRDNNYVSECVNCNRCAIMCDSENLTRCYNKKHLKQA